MSWTYELKVAGNGGKWSGVGMRFPTEAEAKQAALRKFNAWTMAEDWRVVEVDLQANYTIDDQGEFREIPVRPISAA